VTGERSGKGCHCLRPLLLPLVAVFLAGEEGNMSAELPPNEYYELFKPEYSLHIQPVPDLANANSRKQLDQIKQVRL
jgi:hypothetical protein